MLMYFLDKLKTSILLHSYNLGLEQHLLGDDNGKMHTKFTRLFERHGARLEKKTYLKIRQRECSLTSLELSYLFLHFNVLLKQ